ncbi:hypothetical protein LPJ75_006279 [Coemansia sp. RSA 2598]|nr:hypothetical protein LPJ75_006279 [Coemansia sp. RSA 2598]
MGSAGTGIEGMGSAGTGIEGIVPVKAGAGGIGTDGIAITGEVAGSWSQDPVIDREPALVHGAEARVFADSVTGTNWITTISCSTVLAISDCATDGAGMDGSGIIDSAGDGIEGSAELVIIGSTTGDMEGSAGLGIIGSGWLGTAGAGGRLAIYPTDGGAGALEAAGTAGASGMVGIAGTWVFSLRTGSDGIPGTSG